ncbi:MAG: DNA polymerase, partial [bacterium]|nr:DNA polymerase [bacterium]
ERMAINHPIQGSEADIMKKAMIRIYEKVEKGNGPFRGVRMILQVHDELVFEVPKAAAESVGRAVREIMESVEKLSVPLVAEAKAGPSWGEMRALRG